MVQSVKDIGNFGNDFAKAVFAGNDYEAGRLAVKPVMTAMTTTAAVMGTRLGVEKGSTKFRSWTEARKNRGVFGPGTLNTQEAAQLQRLADFNNTQIDVVGSRAAGKGRSINTELPVGKGPGTRSDIDFRYDTQVEIDTSGRFTDQLREVGKGAGAPSFHGGSVVRSSPPVIEFRPNTPAVRRIE